MDKRLCLLQDNLDLSFETSRLSVFTKRFLRKNLHKNNNLLKHLTFEIKLSLVTELEIGIYVKI